MNFFGCMLNFWLLFIISVNERLRSICLFCGIWKKRNVARSIDGNSNIREWVLIKKSIKFAGGVHLHFCLFRTSFFFEGYDEACAQLNSRCSERTILSDGNNQALNFLVYFVDFFGQTFHLFFLWIYQFK